MRTSRTIRLALWFSERAQLDEALAGDLIESYERTGSRVWLVRQLLAAAATKGFAEVKSHKVLALRALAVGWIAQNWLGAIARSSLAYHSAWEWRSEMWLDQFLGFPVLPPLILVVNVIGAVVIGWIVSRLHRPFGLAMGMLYSSSLLLVMLGGLVNSLPRVMTWQSAPTIAFETAFSFLVVPGCLLAGVVRGGSSARLGSDTCLTPSPPSGVRHVSDPDSPWALR